MNLSKILRQPYPVPESAGNEWVIGAFVGGFLLLFQPFGISDWQTSDKILKVLGFGAVTTVVMILFDQGTKLLPHYFAEERWTVGKEIAKILTLILFIAIANRLYMSWLVGLSMQGGWLWAIGITFLLGIFPTVGVVLTNYIIQLRKYEQQASHLALHKQPTEQPVQLDNVVNQITLEAPQKPVNKQIVLTAENEKDMIQLYRDDLLAIESSDNYCTVFYQKNGTIAKELIRSSLSRLENQLGTETPFVRCHRSYVVNLDRVNRVSGNAQGYKLHLLNGQLTVPVARKYNDTLVAGLK
ncbi:LytR/AlgR family response regulator transcription factor [Fibrella forsythiae]|uniref:LytTR family transcriptional regulator n=1 Tax=Fibrella forsythiae TaxID=2817061 RepID=A0ABS3JFH4_9BACT|nr:LytTR family DNA-binding domain-containing protein [Fibrella forsythiae]MBO0948745.1 LytTR family transcriptional regulator [Fibrella forsythiae]